MSLTRVAIVGASGYTGVELVRLLLGHPRVVIACVCAHKRAGERLDDVFPSLRGCLTPSEGTRFAPQALEAFDADVVAARSDAAFVALPHGESAACVDALRARGLRVVDLSADFRLRDAAIYQRWYGAHGAPARLHEAVYGLPELHREALRGANLIASPGCYPTATLLAITPLVRARLVETDGIIVDAKSGVSGAGRAPSAHTHFPEIAEGIRAYGVTSHRHTPEIEQEIARLAGREVRITFTPNLVPMSRGLLSTVYATPAPGVTAAAIRDCVAEAWGGEPFGVAASTPPDTAHVRGSNRAHVAAWLDERAGRVVAMAAIDNLVKGASGQAVQSFNLAVGFPEDEGLRSPPLFP